MPPMCGWRRRQRRRLRSESSERRCNWNWPAGRLARSSGFAASWCAFQRHATAEPDSKVAQRATPTPALHGTGSRTAMRLFSNRDSRSGVRATRTKKLWPICNMQRAMCNNTQRTKHSRQGVYAQTVALDHPNQATVICSPEGWSNSEFSQSDNAWMNEQRALSARRSPSSSDTERPFSAFLVIRGC